MKKVILLVAVGFLAGCATTSGDPNRNAKEMGVGGAALGALAGAVIGFQQDHSGGALRGALIGGALGGAAGATAGSLMDKQQADFNSQLAEEKRRNDINIERLRNDNLKITIENEVSFNVGSSVINKPFERTLNKISDILNRYPNSNIRIVGHTDNTGSEYYNDNLSRERARSVKYYLEDHGVGARRVTSEGRGSSQPRATNQTASGRQLNRRVELFINPT